jgi:co-chaperonin GroES (HSP10)
MQNVSMSKSVDNSLWITPDEVKDLKDKELPSIPGYHLLIRPVAIKRETKGGIIMPDKVVDDIAYLTTIGKVLALGDLAYQDKVKFPKGAWCDVGDYVCYGKFTGQKMSYKGYKLLLVFDDQVIMKVQDPSVLDPTYNLSN